MPGILINLNKEINSCCLPSGSGHDGITQPRLKLSHITSTIFSINGHERINIGDGFQSMKCRAEYCVMNPDNP